MWQVKYVFEVFFYCTAKNTNTAYVIKYLFFSIICKYMFKSEKFETIQK